MPRPWSCPVHGAAANVRWVRNGPRARKRVCADCHRANGPHIRGRTTCPRCGGSRIEERVLGDHLRRRCIDCVRNWSTAARRRNPEKSRQAQRRYAVRMGIAEPRDGEADPWVENAAALDAALHASATGAAS